MLMQEIPHGQVCVGGSCMVWNIENFDDYKTSERFYLFVIKKETWNDHTFNEILRNNIYDKMYIYTYSELKAMNFQINYKGE